jgi:hypothetical protein
MTKLSRSEARLLIKAAWMKTAELQMGTYRFGRILWGLLPDHLRKEFIGTNKDFFLEGDSDKVLRLFNEYYVEENSDE